MIPIDYTMLIAGVDYQYISYVRLIRLLKVFRVLEIVKMIRGLHNISLTEYNLILSVFWICLSGHVVACIFYWVGKYEDRVKDRFDHKTLFEDMRNRPYLDYGPVQDMPAFEKYIHFLYFGIGIMCQILAGDMAPYGHLEETLGLIILLISKFSM